MRTDGLQTPLWYLVVPPTVHITHTTSHYTFSALICVRSPGIQATFRRRDEFWNMDSTPYYLDEVVRLSALDFEPTEVRCTRLYFFILYCFSHLFPSFLVPTFLFFYSCVPLFPSFLILLFFLFLLFTYFLFRYFLIPFFSYIHLFPSFLSILFYLSSFLPQYLILLFPCSFIKSSNDPI